MAGFGQSPTARNSTLKSSEGRTQILLPPTRPSSNWTGTAGSGFSSLPSDPQRVAPKPVCRLLVPPGQVFEDSVMIGVAAAANANGTLIGGVDRVRFHFEGTVRDVVEPTRHSFRDANGNEVSYWGYWARLKATDIEGGEAELFIEAIPADATMQNRVMGPYSFHKRAFIYDVEYTIDPEAPATETNHHSFDAAIAQVKADSPENPRITFKRAMTNVEMNFAGTPFSPVGYITVEADEPVNFGRTTVSTSSSVDTESALRPRVTGLWLKGANITIDYGFVDTVYAEDGKPWVLDGVTMTNSRGPNALWRGGPYWSGFRIRGNPYLLEINATNLENPGVGANLVRGGIFKDVSRDIFADARCVVGTRVERHNDNAFNDDFAAFAVQYTGVESTATVARSGSVDPNDCTYTFTWGTNSATFSTGKRNTYYSGDIGDGYSFGELVDWINTVLAAQDDGWSAVLHDALSRRASSGSLLARKAQGFSATDCKAEPLFVVSSFDAHGDWWQQRFNSISENVVAYDNIAYDMQTQNIFLQSNVDAMDFIFFNNALGNDPVGSNYFDASVISSQLGRSQNDTKFSHVVIAHCSLPNQRLLFRNDGTPTTFDSYCLVANNALAGFKDNQVVRSML